MSDSCHERLPNLTNLHSVYHKYWQEMKSHNERKYAIGKAKSGLIKLIFRNRPIFTNRKIITQTFVQSNQNINLTIIELADWPSGRVCGNQLRNG